MNSLHKSSFFSWLLVIGSCLCVASMTVSTLDQVIHTDAHGRRVGVNYRRCHACRMEYRMNDRAPWTCLQCGQSFDGQSFDGQSFGD